MTIKDQDHRSTGWEERDGLGLEPVMETSGVHPPLVRNVVFCMPSAIFRPLGPQVFCCIEDVWWQHDTFRAATSIDGGGATDNAEEMISAFLLFPYPFFFSVRSIGFGGRTFLFSLTVP